MTGCQEIDEAFRDGEFAASDLVLSEPSITSPVMQKVGRALIGTIGVLGSLIAIVSAPSAIWDWLYPVPLIAVLLAALVGSWIYIWAAQRKPSQADQQRLDRLLSALPREAIRRFEGEDFATPWRERSVFPVTWYVQELDGVEEHFDSKAMEKRRRRLYAAADRFMWEEAKKGFVHEQRSGFRNTGFSLGEIEGDDKKLAMAEERGEILRSAAAEFLKTYDDLLATARRYQLKLDAMSSDPPVAPWEHDEDTVI